jgi:hypothetical protein
MSNHFRLPVFINAHRLFEWDKEPVGVDLAENPTFERFLQYVCTPGEASDITACRTRYQEASAKDTGLFVSIQEPELVANLFWPLLHAKTSYLTGNYLGTIAVCGAIAEKVAILIHALHVHDEEQRAQFEALDQEKRVRTLKANGWTNQQQVQDFGDLRAIRRRYLHYWVDAVSRVRPDALQGYAAAVRLVLSAMGVSFERPGEIALRPDLVEYLHQRGVVQDPPSSSEEPDRGEER